MIILLLGGCRNLKVEYGWNVGWLERGKLMLLRNPLSLPSFVALSFLLLLVWRVCLDATSYISSSVSVMKWQHATHSYSLLQYWPEGEGRALMFQTNGVQITYISVPNWRFVACYRSSTPVGAHSLCRSADVYLRELMRPSPTATLATCMQGGDWYELEVLLWVVIASQSAAVVFCSRKRHKTAMGAVATLDTSSSHSLVGVWSGKHLLQPKPEPLHSYIFSSFE